MNSVFAALHLNDPASLKRAFTVILTAVAFFVRPVLQARGVPMPSDEQMTALAGVVATYILQSGAKSIIEAHAEGKVAAAQVDSIAKADSVITAAIVAQKEQTP